MALPAVARCSAGSRGFTGRSAVWHHAWYSMTRCELGSVVAAGQGERAGGGGRGASTSLKQVLGAGRPKTTRTMRLATAEGIANDVGGKATRKLWKNVEA